MTKKEILEALSLIFAYFPDPKGELDHRNNYELLIAVILSAQTTDLAVNKVTKELFAKYPTPALLAHAKLTDVMDLIKTIGLYRNKAKNIIATAQILVADFKGHVPSDKKELLKMPGVGNKSANVVLADGFKIPALAVDTHVERVSKRIGFVKKSASVEEVEAELMKKIPQNLWIKTHHSLVLFGRYHCLARNPQCRDCTLRKLCRFITYKNLMRSKLLFYF